MTVKPKPHIHGRDHSHGGPDVRRIVWESTPAPVITGVNDAVVHVTWTYLGGIFGVDTVLVDTLADGATPGYWETNADGTAITCGLAAVWQVDVAGTVTHSSTTAETIVRFQHNSTETDMFDETMAAGSSSALTYTTSEPFADGDTVRVLVTHAASLPDTPESTFTGTIVFTQL